MPAWMFLAKCVNLQDSIELAIWGNRIQEILLETRSTRNSCHFYFVQCYPARAFPYIDSQFAEQVLTFKQSLISFSFRLCVLLTVRYIQINVKDIYDNLSQLLLRMLWSRNAIIRLWIPNSDLSKIRIQFYSQNVDQNLKLYISISGINFELFQLSDKHIWTFCFFADNKSSVSKCSITSF